jgi:CBS domain-containing protein
LKPDQSWTLDAFFMQHEPMRAEHLMTVDVTCINPGMNLSFAWTVMKELGTRHLPVLEGEKLVGMLSHRDLMLHGQPKADGSLSFPERTAGETMTKTLHTCTPSATVSEVAQVMVGKRVSSVPIVSAKGELVGLVTSTDLMKLLVESDATRALPFSWALRKRS